MNLKRKVEVLELRVSALERSRDEAARRVLRKPPPRKPGKLRLFLQKLKPGS